LFADVSIFKNNRGKWLAAEVVSTHDLAGWWRQSAPAFPSANGFHFVRDAAQGCVVIWGVQPPSPRVRNTGWNHLSP
jgi:hypothetical protein